MPHYFDPAAIAQLKGLTVRARRVVEGVMLGMHKSPFRGISAEFAQHRSYVPGDDLRHLDWKVYGKSDRFYVKQFVKRPASRATLCSIRASR